VFSDYLCPYCRQLAVDVLPVIERELVPNGAVALAFVDFPLASHGYPALVSHEAAHCAAEQGRYWDMHDALFAAQAQLAPLDPRNEVGSARAVLGIGQGIGLDVTALEPCVKSKRYRPLVAAMAQKALDSCIRTAPTLLLQSETRTDLVTGYVPVDVLRPTLQAALRAATEEAPPRR
jgi:protein-disulfide isomerase